MPDPSAATTAAQIAEEAWQLNQRFLHADYIGDEPDMFQLRRDLAFLSLLVHQLAEEVDDAAT
jgi:hypothetical protein